MGWFSYLSVLFACPKAASEHPLLVGRTTQLGHAGLVGTGGCGVGTSWPQGAEHPWK